MYTMYRGAPLYWDGIKSITKIKKINMYKWNWKWIFDTNNSSVLTYGTVGYATVHMLYTKQSPPLQYNI